MEPLTSSLDAVSVLVADASTIINLNATGSAASILTVLPHAVKVLDTVLAELEQGQVKGRKDAVQLKELVADDLVQIVTLGEQGLSLFETLVIGPASETLDDGEAATIAYALESGALPLIDEHKANRLCGRRFPTLQMACTVDLFAYPGVGRTLGKSGLEKAVLGALQGARMQVSPRHLDWVITLIGRDQAALCPSLPNIARKPLAKRSGVR